jgi:hypothetical protein
VWQTDGVKLTEGNRSWTIAIVAAVGALLLVTARARAQPLSPALLETEAEGVEVALTHLEARCRDGIYGATCAFVARFTVVARGDVPVDAVFSFTEMPTVVRLDGVEDDGERAGYELAVELSPGQPRQVEVESVASQSHFHGRPWNADCWGNVHSGCPGAFARHAVVGRYATPRWYGAPWLSIRVEDAAVADLPLVIVVTHPSSWHLSDDRPDDGVDFERSHDGRTTRIHVPVGGQTIHADLAVRTSRPRNRGGPFLGLGRVARDRAWLRGGYEHPFVVEPTMVSLSGLVETDGREVLVVAVLAEVATSAVIIFPSLSFGVGVPVQILPEPAGGFRVQMSLHPRLIGLEVSVDRYPRLKDTRWAWTFRVSI